MSALYLHIPFCLSKCPYCDFYSRIPQSGDIERYVDALCLDLERSRAHYLGGKFSSVFFGGGTPSLLNAHQVARLLKVAERCYGFEREVEITLEANPGTLTAQQLSGFRQAGVNRLSLGVQSLDDKQLAWLGRRHSSQQAIAAVEMARCAGFDRLSLDLMFALPLQSLADLKAQCQRIRQLSPEHLSIYGLTVESGTPFAAQQQAGLWQLPDEEAYRDAYLYLHEQLTSSAYEHYEISNFAQSQQRCRHNYSYWQRQPYLGVGAGAHSFFANRYGERWACTDSVDAYYSAIDGQESPRWRIETFTKPQAMAEAVYLALRCKDGLDVQRFEKRYAMNFVQHFSGALKRCGAHVTLRDGRCSLDVEGWLLFNYLIEDFL
ncbi:MAG: radical SAM family heme chaperone HemW [Desulfuromonas sp.]|nr:radical SAM family heme chaperone HemW [Desulfuromonas sp.]